MVQRRPMSDIHAYLDGALNEAERRRFEAMLEFDPDAAGMVRQYRQQAEELRRLYEPVMSEPVPDRMLALLRGPVPAAGDREPETS